MIRCLLTAGLLALGASIPAAALTLTFTDRGTWTSSVTVLSNFDGGAQTAGTATNFNTSSGLILTDLQIVGFTIAGSTGYDLSRVNASGSQPWYQWNSGTIFRSGDKTAATNTFIRITFPNPVSAFGFNFGVGGSSGVPGSVTIAPGGLASTNVTTLQQPNWTFWGVASDSQTFTFADIVINDNNRYLVIDDIAQGTYSTPPPPPTETAEPGTLLQLAMGGGLLAFARRRWNSQAAEPAA